MDKQTLISALKAQDSSRPRSQQTEIGVSSLGGCRRKVWLELKGTPKTNPTSSLAAVYGTAIHATIESAVANLYPERKPGERPIIEHRVEIDGLPPATIDYFDPLLKLVVDWKTTKVKNLGYFPNQQQRWQVQVYAYLLTCDGFEVENVALMALARDGDEDDVVYHVEPYSESIALEALGWLDDVKSREEAPNPEKDAASFCQKYCGFYGSACTGIGKDYSGDVITDVEATEAANRYIALASQIKALEAQQDAAKAALLGVSGVTVDGIKVSWSEVAGRKTPDVDAIKFLLPEVPMKQGAPSLRLSVK